MVYILTDRFVGKCEGLTVVMETRFKSRKKKCYTLLMGFNVLLCKNCKQLVGFENL